MACQQPDKDIGWFADCDVIRSMTFVMTSCGDVEDMWNHGSLTSDAATERSGVVGGWCNVGSTDA